MYICNLYLVFKSDVKHQWEIYVYKLKHIFLYEMAQKKITATFILSPCLPSQKVIIWGSSFFSLKYSCWRSREMSQVLLWLLYLCGVFCWLHCRMYMCLYLYVWSADLHAHNSTQNSICCSQAFCGMAYILSWKYRCTHTGSKSVIFIYFSKAKCSWSS